MKKFACRDYTVSFSEKKRQRERSRQWGKGKRRGQEKKCRGKKRELLRKRQSNIFWDITPSSPLKVYKFFGCYVPPETSVDCQRTTRRYIPEDSRFHNHRCESLKSYKRKTVSEEEQQSQRN
jgi:hypothetical protein